MLIITIPLDVLEPCVFMFIGTYQLEGSCQTNSYFISSCSTTLALADPDLISSKLFGEQRFTLIQLSKSTADFFLIKKNLDTFLLSFLTVLYKKNIVYTCI